MKNKKQTLLLFLILLTLTTSACKRIASPARPAEPPATATASATKSMIPIEQPTRQADPQQSPTKKQPTESALTSQSSTALQQVSGAYLFTEGPAVDANGNVYFSDIQAGKIYTWNPSAAGSISLFVEGLKSPNGLMFDKNGNLIACEGGSGRLISINTQGQVTPLVETYNGTRFNEPNDLWIDSQGGIYFTDPAYQAPVVQNGQDVYYLAPGYTQVTRVISDLTQPNGIVGTADGKMLYVADSGLNQTYTYTINSNGSLSDKKLFVALGSDGMDLDAAGNLYLTTPNKVQVFDPAGKHLRDIPTTENPTNVAFAGQDGLTLFITARTALYTIQLSAGNVSMAPTASQTQSFSLSSPDLPADSRLPAEYTCDGASSTLALNWSGAPAGTVAYAITMHHVAPDNAIHWYWEVYNLPASVTSLPKNSSGLGTLGTNSVNDRNEYAPPCSKGPGDKEYIYTVYALSAQPQISIPANKVNRAALLEAIQDISLASAELHVVYARP
jgi:gluconolactonase